MSESKLPSVGDQVDFTAANEDHAARPSTPREGDVLANRKFWEELEDVFSRYFDKSDDSVKFHATVVVSEAREGFDQSDVSTLTEENIAEEAVIFSQNLARDEVDAAKFSAIQLKQAAEEFEVIVHTFLDQQRGYVQQIMESLFANDPDVQVEKVDGMILVSGTKPKDALDDDFQPAFDLDD